MSKLIKYFFILLCFLFYNNLAWAQNQVVRGVVIDQLDGVRLPAATVLLKKNGAMEGTGTNTDVNGAFEFSEVPYGRYVLEVHFIGYQTFVKRAIVVGAGKEVVVQAALMETATLLDGLEVTANTVKNEALNPLAGVSAVQFSIEEARRYAGGLDDPARLVTSFAGVAGNTANNGIVIRGNAPKGVLWRLEGVDIPNPSHFSDIIAFGAGGITALSSFALDNSDFYTAAFPANYGNALSGVFDMKLREGNNQKHEHAVQMGLIGLDLASEGPLSSNKKSSYLFNYRYSTLGLLQPVLPEDAEGTAYQDLSFKLNFPWSKNRTFSIWGFAGADKSSQQAVLDSANWVYEDDREGASNQQQSGAFGLNYVTHVGNKSKLTWTASMSIANLKWASEVLDQALHYVPLEKVNNRSSRWATQLKIETNVSNNHFNSSGFTINWLQYNIDLSASSTIGAPLVTVAKDKGDAMLLQGYSQSKWWLHHNLDVSLGAYVQYFQVNNELSIEPRMNLGWSVSEHSKFNLGYGFHGQLEKLPFYLMENDGIQINKDLKTTKAHHFVLSYERMLSETRRFKVELFHQYLLDVPVEASGTFSMLNLEKEWFITQPLFNNGSGRNLGVDCTLEQFFQSNFYYLATGSLFKSQYTGADQVWRSTRYDKGYVLNLVGGKEWLVGKSKTNMLDVNIKITWQGGDKLSPVDASQSHNNQTIVYDETMAFSDSKPSQTLFHFTINYRKNRARHASVWTLQVMNAFGAKEFYGYRYNQKEQSIDPFEETLLLPNLAYKIEF